MNRAFFGCLLATCLVGSALAWPAYAVSEQQARAAADAMATKYETAFNAVDADGIANLYSDDATYFPPWGEVLTGRQAIKEAMLRRFKNGVPKVTIRIIEAHPAGDDVWATGETMFTMSESKSSIGHFAYFLLPEGNEWRLRMAISNIAPPK